MKELKDLVRENIWKLTPYSSARDEYSGHVAHVFIDANENPYNKLYNRYPDPLQKELKKKIARIKGVAENSIFLGNGSDEAIDLVYRCFCTPMKDNVVAIEPTYGMYKVCADINNVEYRKVLLDSNFNMNARELLAACDENTKVIWICTPNNPSGNDISRNEIEYVIENFQGVVVVDEAYSDFSRQKAFRTEITKYPNLIVNNEYVTMHHNINFTCLDCHNTFDRIAADIFYNGGCPVCNVNNLPQRQPKTLEQFLIDLQQINKALCLV
jgi:histidinol-phosphate aminotransferase